MNQKNYQGSQIPQRVQSAGRKEFSSLNNALKTEINRLKYISGKKKSKKKKIIKNWEI